MVGRKKAKKKSKLKQIPKAKTKGVLERPKKSKPILKSSLDKDQTQDLRKHFLKEHNTKIKEINKIHHIEDYNIYKVETYDGKEYFMVEDWDSVTEAAMKDVEASWADYEDVGLVTEETDIREFAEDREGEILAGFDGVIYEGAGYYYWRYN